MKFLVIRTIFVQTQKIKKVEIIITLKYLFEDCTLYLFYIAIQLQSKIKKQKKNLKIISKQLILKHHNIFFFLLQIIAFYIIN